MKRPQKEIPESSEPLHSSRPRLKWILRIAAVLYASAYVRAEVLHLFKDQATNPFQDVDYPVLRREASGLKQPTLNEIDCQLEGAADFKHTTQKGTFLKGRAMDWTNSIVRTLQDLGVPPTKENVSLALVLLHRESRMDVNPAMDVRSSYNRRREKYTEKARDNIPTSLLKDRAAAGVNGYFDLYQEGIDNANTETEVEAVLREIYAPFKVPIWILSKLSPSPQLDEKLVGIRKTLRLNTVGALQVNPLIAVELKASRGEEIDWEGAKEWLYTTDGNFESGFAILFTSLEEYRELGIQKREAVQFAFSDYNAGIYSSRNAGFQTMLADLTDEKLTPDGDLLSYDHDGVAWARSKTEGAIQQKYPDLSIDEIREELLLEKGADFDKTKIYRRVSRDYSRVHEGKTIRAVTPDAGDPDGEDKYGKTFTATQYTEEAMNQYNRFRWKVCK